MENKMPDVNDLITRVFQSKTPAIKKASDIRGKALEALIAGIQSGEDFDTDWYGVGKVPQAGRIQRVGSTLFCSVRISSDFDELGEGCLQASTQPRMQSDRIAALIEHAMDTAITLAEKDLAETQAHKPNAMLFQIGKDEHVLVDEYLLPMNRCLGMKRPPTSAYKTWGYQDKSAEIPTAIKDLMDGYAKTPASFFRDAKEDTSYGSKEFRVDKRIGKTVWHIRYSPTRE